MGKAKGKNLKTALQSQQSRLKVKLQIEHAAQVADQKSRNKNGQQSKTQNVASSSAAGKGKLIATHPRRVTIPFRPTDTILLVGEGNFSFARALVYGAPSDLEFLPPKNVTATAYDTEDACYDKYPDAIEIVALLRDKGVEVLFGVDATRLERVKALHGRRWDHVVWNFPHAGQSGKCG